MRWIQRIFAFFMLCPLALGGAAWDFRTVEGQVLGVDGSPAPGVKVELVALERDAISEVNSDRNAPKWSHVTDAHGRFSARFGNFRSYEYEQATGRWHPGLGGFYFVATKKGTAGGVSPLLRNEGGGYQAVGSDEREWSTGEFAPVDLGGAPVSVTIRLKKGITVAGTVTDPEGRPLKGERVNAIHDLHAWSHTGHGGESLPANAVTDSRGRYRISGVYPNRFSFEWSPSSSGSCCWIKTRLRGGPWVEDRLDDVTPAPGEKEIRLDLMLAKEAPYFYSGQVVDAAGRPVAKAKVTLGVSLHWPPKTHEDTHSFLYAETDAEGRYSIRSESPFAGGIAVEAPGYERAEQWAENAPQPYRPGRYDFTLPPGRK